MSEWQKIETAPKDGSDILLFVPGCSEFCQPIVIGHWSMGIDGVQRDEDDWYETRPDGGPCLDVPPTHWMPLPSPPHPLSEETK